MTILNNEKGLALVETEYAVLAQSPDELVLESGRRFGPVTVAFERYGELNADGDNAILITHGLSADAHAAGRHAGDEEPGWWDSLIGPGKAFDTDKYHVIATNVIGGCRGSSGPSSIDPTTGKPYGLDFPIITIRDIVEVQRILLDHLGIGKLLCVAGGSMGGMQALQWAASNPDRVHSVIPIATTSKHSPQQIAFGEVGRQAVMADPAWNRGDYYGSSQPEAGLSVARMVGHITYMSDTSMEEKFSRKTRNGGLSFSFLEEFEVEGYLRYQGDSFVQRFDANSYLYLTKALDYFDVFADESAFGKRPLETRFLLIAFSSDWLYPPRESRETVRQLKLRGADVSFVEIDSDYGHDAFLLESEEQAVLISHFLERNRLETEALSNGAGI